MKRNLLAVVLMLSSLTVALTVGSVLLKLDRFQKPIHVSDGSGPNDQLRQLADGTGPIPTCRPGTCGPNDQLRQLADGTGPIPTCRPKTCGPNDQLRLEAMQGKEHYAEIYAG